MDRKNAINLIRARITVSFADHGDWITVRNERGAAVLEAKISVQEYINDNRDWELCEFVGDDWAPQGVGGVIKNGPIDPAALRQDVAEKIFAAGLGYMVDPSLKKPAADHGFALDFE